MLLLKKIKNQFIRLKNNETLSIISDYKKIDGWLTENEAAGLYLVASRLEKDSVIVEIGSWKGKSTFCLATGLKSGKIYAIDPFNAEGEEGSKETYENTRGDTPLYDQFITTLKKYGLEDKIEPLKGYSSEFVDRFTQIDFLFIDGDHSVKGCDYDFIQYSPMVTKGGFIAFHDFDSTRDDLGPTWVIKNRIMNNPDFHFYRSYDSLWVAQKMA